MTDIVDRIADILIEDHVDLMRENKVLREVLAAYAERYKCKYRHHWCKRCELDRRAACSSSLGTPAW